MTEREKLEIKLKDFILKEIQENYKVVNFEMERIRILEKRANNEFYEMSYNYIQESKNKMITKLDTIENFNFYSMCKSLLGKDFNSFIDRVLNEAWNSVYSVENFL